jgi:hypothetical protein
VVCSLSRSHNILYDLVAAICDGAELVELLAGYLWFLAFGCGVEVAEAFARRDGGNGGTLCQDLIDL